MRHDSTIARDLRSRLVISKHGKQLSIVQIRRAKAQAQAWWKDAEILMLRHQLAVVLRERRGLIRG